MRMRTAAMADPSTLAARFQAVRALSVALVAPLSDADATAQSMEDASPAKWHLAHTTWFLETFVLRDFVGGYAAYDARFAFLFNSYYEAEGQRHARDRRGMITRPSLDEVIAYRAHVDAAVLAALPDLPAAARDLVTLGCHHEEQHQELLLTDILHLMAQNPVEPTIWAPARKVPVEMPGPVRWIEGISGLAEIGCDGPGFTFDCEGPRHQVLLSPHALADRTVTNGEWARFIADGGYADARHWLSDGWAWVSAEKIVAPLYWEQGEDGGWTRFGLDGRRAVDSCGTGYACEFLRGGRLCQLGRWAAADRGRMGSRSQCARSGGRQPAGSCRSGRAATVFGWPRLFRRCVGMDGQRVPALSGLQAGRGRGRRI